MNTIQMLTIYGIPNCDTMKKARRWLADGDIEYHFHDYRKDGIDASLLSGWIDALGEWEPLINRRGTTWRKLHDSIRDGLDQPRAIALMVEHPALIKRPVAVEGNRIEIGFDADRYSAWLSGKH